MKKLLTILSAFALTATGASTVVACGDNKEEEPKENPKPDTGATDEEKVDAAVAAVKKIGAQNVTKDEVAVLKSHVIDSIKTAIGKDGVTLDGDITIINKATSKALADGEIKTGVKLTISGKLKLNAVTKPFTVDIDSKIVSDKEVVDDAIKALKGLADHKITMDLATVDIAKLIKAIENDADYKKALGSAKASNIELFDGSTKVEVVNAKAVLIKDKTITVKGDLSSGTETGKFEFTIKLDQTKPTGTDLAGLKDAAVTSDKTLVDFSAELIKVLQGQDPKFAKISDQNIEILTEDGKNKLEEPAIKALTTGGKIKVTIKAKDADKDFTGSKTIEITWTTK